MHCAPVLSALVTDKFVPFNILVFFIPFNAFYRDEWELTIP